MRQPHRLGAWCQGAGKRNFEPGFVTEDFDTVDRVSAMFEGVWSGAECRTRKLPRAMDQ